MFNLQNRNSIIKCKHGIFTKLYGITKNLPKPYKGRNYSGLILLQPAVKQKTYKTEDKKAYVFRNLKHSSKERLS